MAEVELPEAGATENAATAVMTDMVCGELEVPCGEPKVLIKQLVYCCAMKKQAGFHAEDAEFANRVRESFARQGLMKHLGAELVELTAGHAAIRVPFRTELTQQHNYFHAGVSGAIADSACGYAAYTLMPADSSVLTVEYKLNLLAPADGEELTARARVVRSGRTLKICAADVHAKKSGKEVHCATMLATIMCLTGKSDRTG